MRKHWGLVVNDDGFQNEQIKIFRYIGSIISGEGDCSLYTEI